MEVGDLTSATAADVPAGNPSIRVLLADDHPIVRDGLKKLLELESDIDEPQRELELGFEGANEIASVRRFRHGGRLPSTLHAIATTPEYSLNSAWLIWFCRPLVSEIAQSAQW